MHTSKPKSTQDPLSQDLLKKRTISKEALHGPDSSSTKSSSNKDDSDSDRSPALDSKQTRCYIGKRYEAPEYTIKSQYILNGYRIGFTNMERITRSLLMLHNETTNIWSHLFGALLYIFLIFYVLFWTAPESKQETSMIFSNSALASFNDAFAKYVLWVDGEVSYTPEISKMPLMVHLFGSILCMAMSSIYHLCYCHSNSWNCRLYKYDYAGVSVMIACSIYPPYLYGFACDKDMLTRYFYLGLINISSVILAIVCVHPKFDNDKYRKFRTVMYCIVGLSCGIPGVQYTFFGDPIYQSFTNVYLWSLGGFFFVFGAFVYFKRFPEKKWPGKFDYFGQSHNIWHFFVLLGGITNVLASLASYYGRRVQVCPMTTLA